jgi:predicted transcriptional regulator
MTSEIFKDEILENQNRRKICQAVEATPGIHLRELQRVLDMAPTTLEYHLTYMARKRVIFGESDGHYKRYYTRPLDVEDKKVLVALKQKRMREIVFAVLANKKARYQFLADYLKLPRSSLSFYLKCLVDNRVLAKEKIGYENIYTVQDESRVAKVFIAYRSSFPDKLADKAVDTWMEKHSNKKETA